MSWSLAVRSISFPKMLQYSCNTGIQNYTYQSILLALPLWDYLKKFSTQMSTTAVFICDKFYELVSSVSFDILPQNAAEQLQCWNSNVYISVKLIATYPWDELKKFYTQTSASAFFICAKFYELVSSNSFDILRQNAAVPLQCWNSSVYISVKFIATYPWD